MDVASNLSLRNETLTHTSTDLKCFDSRTKRGSACTTYFVPCPRNHPHTVWKHCTRLGTIKRTIFGRVLFESSIRETKEKECSTRNHLLCTCCKLEFQGWDGVKRPFSCVKAEEVESQSHRPIGMSNVTHLSISCRLDARNDTSTIHETSDYISFKR